MRNIKNYQNKTDEELVALTLRDKANFAFLIERYNSKLLRYIKRITNVAVEEAEDILQDSFINAYINLNDFDKDLKFSSWIYRITHNQVINNFRKNKVRPQGNSIDIEREILENIAAEFEIEKNIDLGILGKNVNEILSHVEEKYREALILKFLEDKDYREISDILKKPMGTVATLINRGKKQFKQELIRLNIKL